LLLLFSYEEVGENKPGFAVQFQVVNAFPHDRTSFTEGLLYHEGYFYESAGLYGQSSLRKVNVSSGAVLQHMAVDNRYFAEGLALHNDVLYQLEWKAQVVFKYDRNTFQPLERETNPELEGWGLTSNGTSLIMSTGSSRIYFLDPVSFTVVRTIDVKDGTNPVRNLNELEYIKGEIWANVWLTNKIVRINPDTGVIKSAIDCTSIKPVGNSVQEFNGIAYDSDNDRIFVTGKKWPTIFEITVSDP